MSIATDTIERFTKNFGATHGCLIITWPIGEDLHADSLEVCHTADRPVEEAIGIAGMALSNLSRQVFEETKKSTDV